jgi:hypothetical protein
MKILGLLLILVGFCSIDQGGGITWGLIAMIIVGTLMVFPNLVQYLFESRTSERK